MVITFTAALLEEQKPWQKLLMFHGDKFPLLCTSTVADTSVIQHQRDETATIPSLSNQVGELFNPACACIPFPHPHILIWRDIISQTASLVQSILCAS